MSKKKQEPATPEEFNDWLHGLTEMELSNFKFFIRLPNAIELLARMPEGRNREMFIYGVAVYQLTEGKIQRG